MRSKHLSGFTLIEVLVVVALLGIVTALAAPGFASLVQNNRIQAAAGELQRALYYARSEAMSRGVNVIVTTDPEDANGWTGALKISTVNTVVLPTAEVLRQYSGGLGTGVNGTGSVGGSPLTRLTFQPNGSVRIAADAILRVCATNALTPGKQFTLSLGGVLSVTDFVPTRASAVGCG
ncbi:GspH/FimT family pseudopilin [Pseudomonas sp. EpS/L25]|uniref:GspH/FimT family pseudopilin n=1 Tax=Pseudomonas sp. EpS/L25 TaxID=1749078 RepID=UPI0007437076|nr:GspH/FimT family pseudopilin [Pseudomonas sp. EpS/L25]KUM43695.1 type II secretion system protein GspH [Pseudomonas sp. EpS/L25]